jgi:hypothetical protein
VFALGGEELCPGNDFRVLLEQGTALAFGHAAPDTEFDAIVERIGTAFQNHRTVTADDGGLALRRSAYEEFIRIGLTATSLGYPSDAGLGFRAVDKGVG